MIASEVTGLLTEARPNGVCGVTARPVWSALPNPWRSMIRLPSTSPSESAGIPCRCTWSRTKASMRAVFGSDACGAAALATPGDPAIGSVTNPMTIASRSGRSDVMIPVLAGRRPACASMTRSFRATNFWRNALQESRGMGARPPMRGVASIRHGWAGCHSPTGGFSGWMFRRGSLGWQARDTLVTSLHGKVAHQSKHLIATCDAELSEDAVDVRFDRAEGNHQDL